MPRKNKGTAYPMLSPIRIPPELNEYIREQAYSRSTHLTRVTIADIVTECIQDHKDRSEIP